MAGRTDYQSEFMEGSENLIIACTSYGSHGVPASGFEWTGVLSRASCHKIFLRDSMQHWYLGGLLGFSSSLQQTVAHLSELVMKHRVRRILTLGSSMGGYAALLLASLLHAERAIAFSPQTAMTFDWMHAIGDLRWELKMTEMKNLELGDQDIVACWHANGCPGRAQIIYPEGVPLDRVHATRLREFPMCEVTGIEGGDHEVAYAFAKSGWVTTAVAEFLRVDPALLAGASDGKAA